jgi:hypothetical protein
MGRKRKAEPNDKKQSDRFVKIAKQVQGDNAEERFEKTCSIILKTKRKKFR